VRTEVAGKYSKGVQKNIEMLQDKVLEEKEKTLVMGELSFPLGKSFLTRLVSGTGRQRDDIQAVIRKYLKEQVRMLESEYQPTG